MIDAKHNRRIDILATWCRDNDFFRATFEMGRGFLFGRKKSCAFEYHIHIQFTPWNLGRIALGEYANRIAINDHRIAFNGHGTGEFAVRGVIAR